MKSIDYLVISAKNRMERTKEGLKNFMTSEKGVSNVVATIIILLIVVLLIALFWDRLKIWLDDMMNTIFGTEFNTEGMTKPGDGL